MNYLQLNCHKEVTIASWWTTHVPATVDLGSHYDRELFPDPPDVLSRPRIRKRTTRLAPHPIMVAGPCPDTARGGQHG